VSDGHTFGWNLERSRDKLIKRLGVWMGLKVHVLTSDD
jgi:hypothetical protein